MFALQHVGAAAPDLAASERHKDEPRGLAGGAGSEVQSKESSADFRCNGAADQAALQIEGEAYARAYLQRLHTDAASPDDLAVLMSFLTGEMLHGACRLIEKALRGGRHA